MFFEVPFYFSTNLTAVESPKISKAYGGGVLTHCADLDNQHNTAT